MSWSSLVGRNLALAPSFNCFCIEFIYNRCLAIGAPPPRVTSQLKVCYSCLGALSPHNSLRCLGLCYLVDNICATICTFLCLLKCCSRNTIPCPQRFFVLGLATIFSCQLMRLKLQSSIGLVPAQRCWIVKIPWCQKLCKDSSELFEESITAQHLHQTTTD